MLPHVNPPGYLASQDHLTQGTLELFSWGTPTTAGVTPQLLLSSEHLGAVRTRELQAASSVSLQVLSQVGLTGESFGTFRALLTLPTVVALLVTSLGREVGETQVTDITFEGLHLIVFSQVDHQIGFGGKFFSAGYALERVGILGGLFL